MSQIEKKLTSFSARQKTVYSEALKTLTLTNALVLVFCFFKKKVIVTELSAIIVTFVFTSVSQSQSTTLQGFFKKKKKGKKLQLT